MIREMQAIPEDEFSREPNLYVNFFFITQTNFLIIKKIKTYLKETTYQSVIRIQLFEPIRTKMINKK
jgi:hypothetical protein